MAFTVGASAVAAAAAYHILHRDGTVALIPGAGLLILMYGGLLASWRRVGVLERRLQRMQVVLRLREYAEHMVESAPSGLVLLSPQLRVLVANRAFLEGLHLRSDEVVGRRLEEVNGAHELASALRQMLEGGAVQDGLILETAMNTVAENRGLRILLRELNPGDESTEGRLLMIVEGVAEGEYASAVAGSPLSPCGGRGAGSRGDCL